MSESSLNIQVKLLHPDAILPSYATRGSAGLDFYAIDHEQISYGSPVTFRTGISMAIPEGYALLMFSRSGHGFKQDLRLANCVGVIDSDYRGEIKVKLTKDFPGYQNSADILPGTAIAQGIILPIPTVKFEVIESDLPETERGSAGFGSTDKGLSNGST